MLLIALSTGKISGGQLKRRKKQEVAAPGNRVVTMLIASTSSSSWDVKLIIRHCFPFPS